MNKKRGYYTLNIGGKSRSMHFSMNFWANFTDLLGITLDKVGKLFESGVSITALRSLIYSAILAYDQEQKNVIDYDEYDVGNWLEDINAEEIEKIIGAMGESKILGNSMNAGLERNPKDPKKK